ncbi:5-aminovalerate aminotransferase / 4-aminobutyrate aminotransferase [Pseudomonas savastanoi pv. glycinea]|uniref:5-aminovalerate aminotransferase / 4-aminobutyrate aminotransferase n=2 Tax=Pseudomonas savastanoi TaxID=29438 RepID=A0A3M3FWK4_PSESG|nr:5-aminovalerate aminotransferase / 4-aminobutyrate aminotransferase [Pseudomonas savastanoi pv. phaseolicola]RMM66076.1 5-aminovalerate aminotransferase / 4-aminobutyrate aminotransferase [Pseudomonas savastanoi pv. glycinea]
MEITDEPSIDPLGAGPQTTFLKNMIPFRNELPAINSNESRDIGNYWNDPVILFRLRALPDVCLDKAIMIPRSQVQADEQHISESISFVHSMTLSHGRNAEVWDTTGKRYIDFVGGIGVLNLGHCNPQVVTAIQDQAAKLTHYCFNATPHDPYIRFMRQLTEFVPVSYPLSGMLTNSGAEAAENALKIVRGATGRTAVIAFDGGFHGRTLATLNLNGKVAPYKQKVGVLPGPVFHIPFPSKDNGVTTEQVLKALERLLSVEIDVNDVACIIFEPVQGEGGFLDMEADFAQALRAFCDEHGIVLIADEIQSGFGRTGQRFAFSRLGIEPDLILLGKSIAGGIPLGAVVGRKHLLNNLARRHLFRQPDWLRCGPGLAGTND